MRSACTATASWSRSSAPRASTGASSCARWRPTSSKRQLGAGGPRSCTATATRSATGSARSRSSPVATCRGPRTGSSSGWRFEPGARRMNKSGDILASAPPPALRRRRTACGHPRGRRDDRAGDRARSRRVGRGRRPAAARPRRSPGRARGVALRRAEGSRRARRRPRFGRRSDFPCSRPARAATCSSTRPATASTSTRWRPAWRRAVTTSTSAACTG